MDKVIFKKREKEVLALFPEKELKRDNTILGYDRKGILVLNKDDVELLPDASKQESTQVLLKLKAYRYDLDILNLWGAKHAR